MIKNLKKVISTLAAVAILATSASAFAVSFPDVDESASYAGAVEALTTLGIVNGDDNGKFNPENTVTRAEFAKMVVEALGAGNEAASSTDTDFVDAKGHWAAGYIEVGVAKEFINGYDEKHFGPDDQVTYAQAVKMLVAAIGYETYASMQGGWPSGYLAYGSSLDIIAGVSGVSNDTALTRAQCAVLIYNTLKAPICKVDGYEQNYKGEWVPNLEEMNGTGDKWQTLLTSKHDAYVVKGRVMNTDMKEGTVDYLVEAAENFDKIYVTGGKAYNVSSTVATEITPWNAVEMAVGTTNAADMLFTYSEAIVQKDEDTSEYTLVSITPYGAAKTVEFAVKDIDAGGVSAAAIEVKKENSNKTTTYKLDTAVGTEAQLYVNGELVEITSPAASKKFADTMSTAIGTAALAATNKRGTVTLVDATEVGSTSTDGKYDYVMVTYYDVAQVSDVRVKNDEVTVMATATTPVKINWSLVEEDTTSVVFTKDGEEIAYEDVKEDDILVVARDVVGANGVQAAFNDSDWYEVMVSDKTVSGTATGKSTTAGKEYLLVDGTKYEFEDESVLSNSTITPLNAEYVLYLDAMGYVYDFEIDEASKNIGVVVGMYTKAGEENPTVRMIDVNGEIVTYEAKSATEATKIATAVGQSSTSFAKANITDISKCVIEYTLSSGKIVLKGTTALTPVNENDLVGGETTPAGTVDYRESTSKLGGYTIDATSTKIIDLDAYLHSNGDAAAFAAENFEDEGRYNAWIYDRNQKTGVHGLVLLTKGTTSLKPTSALAVVTASGSLTDVDGTSCQVLTVARDGEADIEVLTNYTGLIPEGTVIMYTVGADGYVEYSTTPADNKLHFIFTPAASYADMMGKLDDPATTDNETVLGFINNYTNFTAAAANSYVVTNAISESGYSLKVDGNVDDDVEIYYAPVYSASASVLELFKDQTVVSPATVGKSSINETVAFTLAGANVYTFNYDAIAGEGMSVAVGGSSQKNTLYKNMFGTDATLTNVDWSTMGTAMVDPMAAFVRVVDGDVTDVIYFVAE